MIVVANYKKINFLDNHILFKELNFRIEEGYLVWDYDKIIDDDDNFSIGIYDYSLNRYDLFMPNDHINDGIELKDNYIYEGMIRISFNIYNFNFYI